MFFKSRKFFHVLNERARRKQREQDDRERELLQERIDDPRRKSSFTWIESLIEEDE